MHSPFDQSCMERALELARHAATRDEVPVGAVLALENKIIGAGFNQPIATSDPTSHAELIAIRNGAKKIGNYRLPKTTLYVTLEPCPMCAGAIIHARIERLVVATKDPRTGSCGSVFNLTNSAPPLNHKVTVEFGLLEEECASLLKQFFKSKRRR